MKMRKCIIVKAHCFEVTDDPKRFSRIGLGAFSGHRQMLADSESRYNLCMPHSLEEVRQLAYELPEDQRILLANLLWESVGSDSGNATQIEAAWDGEIKSRLDEIDSGAVQMVPLEDVLARMEARILSRQRG